MNTQQRVIISIVLFMLGFSIQAQNYSTSKPWTYWWWMGNAVNKQDIQLQLQQFSDAGLGGVHIIPIYGAKGYEEAFINFLSEDWMQMVAFTIDEAKKFNLGVDMTMGTGWPFGGKMIPPEYAAKKLVIKEYNFKHTSHIAFKTDTILKNNQLIKLETLLISSQDTSLYLPIAPRIDTTLSQENWKLTCIGFTTTGQKVKRAAPGGKGLVMNYFDSSAVTFYNHYFDSVFSNSQFSVQPRALYHDSYEVYKANWTDNFIPFFNDYQGYNLNNYWPILTDTSDALRPHLIHDMREVIAELLYQNFTSLWANNCTENNFLSRNQAHGSPGNILDLYALASIPETESFGCSNFAIPKLSCDPDYRENTFGRPSPLMMKFASSPAHIMHKPLVSSETGTWLGNHFKVSLQQIKPQIDELFISGINHVFYHGTTYSPHEEHYPGWLFYASTNFGPSAHFWNELPLLNNYITNCQELLQNATPDNDILLYLPMDDLWTNYPGKILLQLDVHKYQKWFSATDFGETAQWLWENGYTFDYISDKQLERTNYSDKILLLDTITLSHKIILIPPVEFIKKETLDKLNALKKNGAIVIYLNQYPEKYSGLVYQQTSTPLIQGNNQVVSTNNLPAILKKKDIRNEELKVAGLDFIRKKNKQGTLYFISNLSATIFKDSIHLNAPGLFVKIIDPLTNKAVYKPKNKDLALSIPPGKSYFIQTLNHQPNLPEYKAIYYSDTLTLASTWEIAFRPLFTNTSYPIKTLDTLQSWTNLGDSSLLTFCGKGIYTATFKLPKTQLNKSCKLIFDDINESARITINGNYIGTIWCIPFEMSIPPSVLQKENTIKIEVQNLSSNYMKKVDKERPEWKKFYDINIVDITYTPLKPEVWEYEKSGITGDIKLVFE